MSQGKKKQKVFVGLSGGVSSLKSDFNGRRKRVFVGLSGGVDSSVSAALLKKAATPKDFEEIFGRPSPEGFRGYDVTGVFIKVWNPASEQGPTRSDLSPDLRSDLSGRALLGACKAADDRLDAMRVCAKLGIPFMELDLEKEYKKEVVDYMIREYKAGKTPNPDVFCNRFIKFGAFYNYALALGADFVATGHYAQVRQLPTNNFQLTTSTDGEKDQSYFLWQIRKEQLPHILFPVGGMQKPEVRKLAKKFGLITADKKDSQGLCFVGKVDMKEFLKQYIKPKKGKVLLAPSDAEGNERGEVIGEHDGAFFYTLGERFGLSPRLNLESGKRFNLGASRPLYVISKDITKNTLTVSHKSLSGGLPLAREEVVIKNCNWLVEPKTGKAYRARIRYRQPMQRCQVSFPRRAPPKLYAKGGQSASSQRLVRVRFESAQNAVAGQSLVLYDGDICLGGGVIAD